MCERRMRTKKKTLILSNSLKQSECMQPPSDSFKREISSYLLKWNEMRSEKIFFLFIFTILHLLCHLLCSLTHTYTHTLALHCVFTVKHLRVYRCGKYMSNVFNVLYLKSIERKRKKEQKKKKKSEMVWFYVQLKMRV